MSAYEYDVCDIPSTQRFDYWREAVCKTYLTVDCLQLDQGITKGFIDANPLGDLSLSHVHSPAMTYIRGEKELKTSFEDHYQLVLMLEGHGVIEQGGVQTAIKSGDMVVYGSVENSKVTYPSASTTQVIKIPRPLLADRIDQVDKISATPLNANTPIGSMTRSLVQECIKLSRSDTQCDNRFCNGVLDILATAIESNLSTSSNHKHAIALTRVKQNIGNRLADPNLNVKEIASLNNISVRTLNRLFASEGITTMRWVWNKRLASAHKYLSEGKAKQVTQIAFDCGFSDLSHFSKSFKTRYQMTPQEVLRNVH